MTKIKIFLLFFIGYPMLIHAQMAPELQGRYPAYIIYRVYQIASKTALSAQKQLQIAQYYKDQDDLNNAMLTQGKPIAEVMNAYVKQQDFIKKILTPLEYNDYKFINNVATPQIAKALKFRDQLNLTTTQTDQLLTALSKLEKAKANYKPMNPIDAFNSKVFEGDEMSKILTDDQYIHALKLINMPKSVAENNDSWAILKRNGFLNGKDTSMIFRQNLDYYQTKDAQEAKIMNTKNIEKLDSVKRYYEINKPEILKKLAAVTNKLPNSQFATAIKFRKEIGLTQVQVDSLLSKANELEVLKSAFNSKNTGRFDTRPFERANLPKILNPDQITTFLNHKNQPIATANSKKEWAKIKELGLNSGLDSNKVIIQLADYDLRYLVANERLNMDKTQQNAFAKKDVENDKPEVLQKMEAKIKAIEMSKNAKRGFVF